MLRKPLFIQIFSVLLDAAFIMLAIFGSGYIANGYSSNNEIVLSGLAVMVFTLISMFFMHVYSLRSLRLTVALARMVMSVIVGISISWTVLYVASLVVPGPGALLYELLLITVALVVSQLLARLINKLYVLARSPERIVIFGAGKTAEDLLENLPAGQKVVGLLDNVRKGKVGKYEILGKLKMLDELISSGRATVVIQAGYFEQTSNLLALTRKYKAQLYVVPQLLGVFDEKLVEWQWSGVDIFQVKQTPLMGWSVIIKRFLDFIGSLILFVVLSPFWLATMLLVWLETRRLPIILEERVNGFSGETVKLFHFRTLKSDSNDYVPTSNDYKQFALDIKKHIYHPQATSTGLFLRKTGLAYLPELLNVIKGELSLVGPRPPYAAELPAYTNHEMARFDVKPGMVSLAQAKRKTYDVEEIVRLDKQYIKSWSLFLDLEILLAVTERYLTGAR